MSDYLYMYFGGVIAGTVGTLVSQPFDTCKIHLQSNTKLNFSSRTFLENCKYMYKGVVPSIIGYSIEKSLVFGTYTFVNKYFELDEKNILHSSMAGFISGSVAALSTTPFEQLKINKQLSLQNNYSISKLYSGFRWTVMRESIGFSIYFSVYNQMIGLYGDTPSTFWIGVSGAISAFIAWIPIYPIDTNKTLIQSGKYKDCVKKTISIASLYNGYGYAMMRAIPFHSTCFIVYEMVKKNKN